VTEPSIPLEREFVHHALHPDIEVIRAYGAAHPEDWTDVLFENEPTVKVLALFAGNVDAHERALRELVPHPEWLVVRSTPYSSSHLEAIRAEVTALARSSEGGIFRSWGVGRGHIQIQVAADQERLAERLRARFGGAAQLKVGVFPYPMDSETSRPENRQISPHPELLLIETLQPSIDGRVALSPGGRWHGPMHLKNDGDKRLVLRTNGALTARVIDPASSEVVGGSFGPQTTPLIRFDIAPGATVDVPLSIEAASFRRRLGYVIPAGDWAIDAVVDVEGVGKFRTAAVPITIIDNESPRS
jgi:hypothetical protein